MGYALRPDRRLRREVRRVAEERLGGAIEQLDRAIGADPEPVDLELIVHEVRKRCKASRGLARLLEPALGADSRVFDRIVRDAANELSTLRDAHALLGTFDTLVAAHPDDAVLLEMRRRHAASVTDTSLVEHADVRLGAARELLTDALATSQQWKLPRSFDPLETGIAATYRRGRSRLQQVRSDPTDHRLHQWRKEVKYLWYQMQLVHDAAPSVLGPLEGVLDDLAEDLGNDHDLAVLVGLVDADRHTDDTSHQADHVISLARRRQALLRDRAIRSGVTIYAESARAFAHRVARYWHLTATYGGELGPERGDDPAERAEPAATSLVERERKFLVDEVPQHALDATAVALRQGYLSTVRADGAGETSGGHHSIRVRDAGPAGCTLTFKAGAGAERTELEWPIQRREFDAAWPHTEGRRIEKTRRRIPHGDHVIELDVFGGSLDGLVVAEVEFASAEALAAFEPPAWFGREVTDDGRYTNAALALAGVPPGQALGSTTQRPRT